MNYTAIGVVQRAIDLGINLVDTADCYGNGRSVEVIGKAIKDKRDKVVITSALSLKRLWQR